MPNLDTIRSLFYAKSVAVVGASANPSKTGYVILKNILEGGYAGAVYPINPGSESILGVPCAASLGDVPGAVDLVVIVVPARAVPDVMRQAVQKGAKGAIIISGGFREIGNAELEAEVMAIAEAGGIAVIGPNCQGVNYLPNKLCASWPLIETRGAMAVVSQSGTIGAAMGGWAAEDGLGVTATVALGNNSGVPVIDLMQFFAQEDDVRVIALNIEGVRDGRQFMEAARAVLQKKPLVLLKPGRTAKGAEAAQSHTKSIAGSDAVFDAACRQIGLIRAEGIAEFYDYSKILSLLPKPAGRRLAILTSSGGSGILAADVAEDLGIALPPLGEEAVQALREKLPPQCVLANPLDLTGDATADRYRVALEALSAYDVADCFLLIFGDPIAGAAEMADAVRQKLGKPIVVAFLGGGEVEKQEVPLLIRAGIPAYPTPERAVRAIGALLRKS
ncbi:MAG: acetate--CoA ligase family protein [Christensenellaceae bacterium]|jgi:acyl-CoA synthetase (NDP forming)|nr:acetate--CoA ligase family protein [Christensenellaceae bacterium]